MTIDLRHDDCLVVLRAMASNSIDAIVTDPPYELGFMGRRWDRTGIAFSSELWCEALRVLKPGGHLVAFAAPRLAHRMVCAIENAGFEIRDQLMWVFGSGFPKSLNLKDDMPGWGTALKPAYEPICLARKPLSEGTVAANVRRWRTGAINIEGCRVACTDKTPAPVGQYVGSRIGPSGHCGLRDSSADDLGRWPANLCHDGSDEVVAIFPVTEPSSGRPRNNGDFKSVSKGHDKAHVTFGHDDVGGSAARFFYCAKAGKKDRAASKHPTVKPVALMRWLVRLVTPPDGTVLDPFAGSGTTLQAAREEGVAAIGIERDDDYVADIRRRLDLPTVHFPQRRRSRAPDIAP